MDLSYGHIALCVIISTFFTLLHPSLLISSSLFTTPILTLHHSHPHSSPLSPSLFTTLTFTLPLSPLTPHLSHPHFSPLTLTLHPSHPHSSPLSPSPISSTLLTSLIFSALTAHTPDNSFLGFAVDVDLDSDTQLAKSNLAVVYGKEPYMWKVFIRYLNIK